VQAEGLCEKDRHLAARQRVIRAVERRTGATAARDARSLQSFDVLEEWVARRHVIKRRASRRRADGALPMDFHLAKELCVGAWGDFDFECEGEPITLDPLPQYTERNRIDVRRPRGVWSIVESEELGVSTGVVPLPQVDSHDVRCPVVEIVEPNEIDDCARRQV